MKRKHFAATLAMALCMALTLTACSPKEVAVDLVYKAVVALGFIEPGDGDEEEVDTRKYAQAGGEITFPEGMDTAESRVVSYVEGDTLYVSFNSIQNKDTVYFIAGSDTVTLTAYATSESTGITKFKTALWELSDDRSKTAYVQGSTVWYPTGGDTSTCQISGLTPGKKYKINISFDSFSYYITGGVKLVGVGSEELTEVENSANA